MNESNFRALCEACDQVLSAPSATLERMAIPWLHVIREHPVFLRNYEDLQQSRGAGSRWRAWWRRRRAAIISMLHLFKALPRPHVFWYDSQQLPGRVDFLFVSHLLNASQAGADEDFYFGRVPRALMQQGYSVLVALINHSGLPAAQAAQRWHAHAVCRAVLADSLSFGEEYQLRQRLKREGRALKKDSCAAVGLLRRVFARASDEASSSNSLMTLRAVTEIGELVQRVAPAVIVTTYEGHAWERASFAVARQKQPQVTCVGYLHAALFRLQHAVRRNLAAAYNPDRILTAGEVGKEQLGHHTAFREIPIDVLGSNRSQAPLDENRKKQKPRTRLRCLVLPEGIAEECHTLFEFSLACALACPDVDFTWRLHPILSYEVLAKQNSRLRDLPRNVVVSRQTLTEDLAACDWALYRGTTAIVQAVSAGLKPIYFAASNELTIDPLYELEGYSAKIASVADFLTLVAGWAQQDSTERRLQRQTAQAYCDRFFIPFDPSALVACVGRKSP